MKRTIFLLVSLLLCATMSAATLKDSTKAELILHVGMKVQDYFTHNGLDSLRVQASLLGDTTHVKSYTQLSTYDGKRVTYAVMDVRKPGKYVFHLTAQGYKPKDVEIDIPKLYKNERSRELKTESMYPLPKQEEKVTEISEVEVRATKKGKDFLWAGTNLNEKDQNLVVYTYPWDGSDVLTADYMAMKRDSVMRANIPGSQPDQWMQTTREQGIPMLTSEVRPIGGRLVQEVHGLWEMRCGALGGPFVSLSRIDTARHRVIVAEGFVYSPGTPKRDLLRELEAALRTLTISAKN